VGSILGGPGGQNSKQKIPEWARAFANWGFGGRIPGGSLNPNADFPQQGPFYDAIMGSQAASPEQLFGGLANQIPGAQRAGSIGRDMVSQGTNQGWQNAMQYGNQANQFTGQAGNIAGMIPNAMEAANYYLQGVTGATQGNNIIGASGAGQQVVDAALGSARQMPAEAYQRVVADALPEVRSSYSDRGLGTSGESARGEQEYIQRTRDKIYQQDVANQIAALGTAASASGAAASQAIGAQQAAAQRGQLGLQASQAPGQILQQMQGVNGSALDALASALGIQAGPGQLAQQGMEGYSQGLNLPLQYQQEIYNLTRDGGKGLLNALAGQQQSVSKSDYRGLFGIKK